MPKCAQKNGTDMTKRLKLTVLNIKTLGPGDYPDATFPGLTFRVGKNRRTWTLRHGVGGSQRREKLGYYHPDNPDSMGLVEARNAARKISDRIDSGAPVAVILSVAEYERLTARQRAKAAFYDLSHNLGREVEQRGLTEEQFLADLEKTKRKVFSDQYGRPG